MKTKRKPQPKTEKNPAGAGRISKASKETFKELFDALKIGHTRKDACALSGISEDTLALWIKGELPKDSDLSHSDFSDQLRKSELHAKDASIRAVRMAAHRDWKAGAWYLKNKHRDEFHEREEHANPDGTALGVVMFPSKKNVPGAD